MFFLNDSIVIEGQFCLFSKKGGAKLSRKLSKEIHEVIIDKMKKEADSVFCSIGAEQRMRMLGDVFREAIIPENKKEEIVQTIKKLSEHFPNACKHTVTAQQYLSDLLKDITG